MSLPLEVARADQELAAVAGAFDYLVYVSPTNDDEAWERFRARGLDGEPELAYRDVDVDVDALRRRLDEVAIDAVADGPLRRLLAGKRTEIGHHLGLLAERGTSSFLTRSIAVSGPVDDGLLALAEGILQVVEGTVPDADGSTTVAAEVFARRAQEEVEAYKFQDPTLTGEVHLRDDIVTLMVSKDQVLVPRDRRIAAGRVDALVHHEVGTHLLTWWNGRNQPLGLLADGLADYEETQEGLGVLAEHLSGGMPPARLGELAVRVVAARSVIDGASFVDTFRLLRDRGATDAQSFGVATRVHRGGGLVKDAGYLRGLIEVIRYLQRGGDLEPLLLGKLPLHAVGEVAALRADGVLEGPRLRPRWLAGRAEERIERLEAATDDVLAPLLAAP